MQPPRTAIDVPSACTFPKCIDVSVQSVFVRIRSVIPTLRVCLVRLYGTPRNLECRSADCAATNCQAFLSTSFEPSQLPERGTRCPAPFQNCHTLPLKRDGSTGNGRSLSHESPYAFVIIGCPFHGSTKHNLLPKTVSLTVSGIRHLDRTRVCRSRSARSPCWGQFVRRTPR
jgi:hypothetical protein